MWGCHKFKLKALNWAIMSQAKACIPKQNNESSSAVVCTNNSLCL